MSNRSSNNELPTGSATNTQTFLQTCVLDADHKALEEHLLSNQVQQSDLDRCLYDGLQMVQRKKRQLSHVAAALTILLQSGAKWNSDDLLDKQKTPYHIICESPGDHHELLELIIKSYQQRIIHSVDIYGRTALMCAVDNANIDCIKCLLAKGADVTLEDDRYQTSVSAENKVLNPILNSIWMSRYVSTYPSVIMFDIFDLLLDAAFKEHKDHFRSRPDYILYALYNYNVYCINKLIKIGAPLDVIDSNGFYVWSLVARCGDVELLKSMFKRAIDKDSIDKDGFSILWHVVTHGNIEAVRYMLDLRVAIPNYLPEERKTQCEHCKEDRLIIDTKSRQQLQNPCMVAIRDNSVETVKLMVEHGSQSCNSFTAIRRAVFYSSVDVVSYLLNTYTYHLNMEYIKVSEQHQDRYYTLLTEPKLIPRCKSTAKITKLLLDHGADPAKQMCSPTSVNAIMTAIRYGNVDVNAQYLRSGVNINFRSYDNIYENVLPFEASVLRGFHDVAKMFLISGCSCGVYSLKNDHRFKNNLKPEVVKLMKEWKVQENNVIPLKQRCRNVILNHLSPRADKKIKKLPLPTLITNFLNISEIDDIVGAHKEADRYVRLG